MDTIIVENTLGDYNEVVPFINKIFKKKFIKIQPKVYLHDEYLNCHYIIKEQQKIVGNVLSYPVDFNCNGQILKACGIGNVAVSKSTRGKSLMSKMMIAAVDEAKAKGIDYMYLGGNRKRYERFGFVPCNTEIEFTVTKENIKHAANYQDVEFIKLTTDSEYISQVEMLYNMQESRYDRKYFYEVLKTWDKNKLYAILADHKVVGHISAGLTGIVDLNIISEKITAQDVVISYYKTIRKLPLMRVFVYPNRLDIVNSLSGLCQRHGSNYCGMINILNYKRCLGILLNMHKTHCEWNIVVAIEDTCCLEIISKGGKVSVLDTDKTADVILPKELATIILTNSQLAAMHGLPFCLPIYTPSADEV